MLYTQISKFSTKSHKVFHKIVPMYVGLKKLWNTVVKMLKTSGT